MPGGTAAIAGSIGPTGTAFLNGVGLSTPLLEAIYSRRGMSLLSQPLSRFTDFETIRREVTTRHCYQVGASAIWWFFKQFVTTRTHDPKGVFEASRRAFNDGNHPVLCFSRNYDFSGSPHCVLPVAWDSSSKPWTISVSDPNDPQNIRKLFVNPDNNAFTYQGTSVSYAGGDWTGGRLQYIPLTILGSRPRTPVWDAVVLILSGVILLVGDGASTRALTDADGNDLHAFGDRARGRLQQGLDIDECYLPVPGYQGPGAIEGELLLASGLPGGTDPRPKEADAAPQPRSRTFTHATTGRKDGTFECAVKYGVDQFRLTCDVAPKEASTVAISELWSGRGALRLRPGQDRLVTFEQDRKLGASRDRLRVVVRAVAASTVDGARFGIRPGFESVDVVAAGPDSAVEVDVETTVDGRKTKARFDVPVTTGVRLGFGALLATGRLIVAELHQLHGPAAGRAALAQR